MLLNLMKLLFYFILLFGVCVIDWKKRRNKNWSHNFITKIEFDYFQLCHHHSYFILYSVCIYTHEWLTLHSHSCIYIRSFFFISWIITHIFSVVFLFNLFALYGLWFVYSFEVLNWKMTKFNSIQSKRRHMHVKME